MSPSETILPAAPTDPVCNELNARAEGVAELLGVRATGRVPEQRPKKFWRVRTVGGVPDSLVHDAWTIVIESFAQFDSDAERLGVLAHGFILAAGRDGWIGGIPCSGVSVFALPQELPDPITQQARYSATYAVSLRGTAA